ncbi:frataxin, mitochondrial [Aplysia californica]|uniref:ferroxidase n=1 Tax=Aplysia californica TaxID=6500 RepID=A0ABM0JZI9_APLCA|nr:frataxin, mitochondrial [Aplysia californica]
MNAINNSGIAVLSRLATECLRRQATSRYSSRHIMRVSVGAINGFDFSTKTRDESQRSMIKQPQPLSLNVCNIHQASRLLSSGSDLQPTEVTEIEYEGYAEETLDSLCDFFEDLPETESCNEDYDCAFASGVLTVHVGGSEGTYVINKQTPNKQLWLSSPISGPKRYDYCNGQWLYLRDGTGLHKLLEVELSDIMNLKINLSKCKFYSG